jgi:hypothetical protein
MSISQFAFSVNNLSSTHHEPTLMRVQTMERGEVWDT